MFEGSFGNEDKFNWSELWTQIVVRNHHPPQPAHGEDRPCDHDTAADTDTDIDTHESPKSSPSSVRLSNDDGDSSLSWIRAVAPQLTRYCDYYYHHYHVYSQQTTTQGIDPHRGDYYERLLVRETRLALRCAGMKIATLATAATAESGCYRMRQQQQQQQQQQLEQLVQLQHLQRALWQTTGSILCRLLSLTTLHIQDPDPRGVVVDSKCRLYAARLLCNLVTGNAYVAVPVAESVSVKAEEGNHGNHVNSNYCVKEERNPNWLDMIVECSRQHHTQRETMGVLVATLYNTLMALERRPSGEAKEIDDMDDDDLSKVWYHDLASNPWLINALLRHLVSAESIIATNAAADAATAAMDETSDWILLLFQRLIQRGYFPTLYDGCAASHTVATAAQVQEDPSSNNSSSCCALPEHSILMFCTQQLIMIHQNCNNNKDDDDDDADTGEGILPLPSPPLSVFRRLSDNSAILIELLTFLANAYCNLGVTTLSSILSNQEESDSSTMNQRMIIDCDVVGTRQMEHVSVRLRILELMADLLQIDNDDHHNDNNNDRVSPVDQEAAQLRLELGRHSTFVHQLAIELATRVDQHTPSNQQEERHHHQNTNTNLSNRRRPAKNERNMDKIPPEDQEWLTSLVRLLGNMCYQCRLNQNFLRQIQLPLPNDSKIQIQQVQPLKATRNVLHVLMTATSLAPYCFTLREWAVIAIRNALEDNTENQSVLAELQGKESVASSDLKSMGLQMKMEATTGNLQVAVLP